MSIKYLNIFQLSQGSTRERLSPPFRMGPERPSVLDASKASSGSGHRKRKLAMGRGRESHQSPRAPGGGNARRRLHQLAHLLELSPLTGQLGCWTISNDPRAGGMDPFLVRVLGPHLGSSSGPRLILYLRSWDELVGSRHPPPYNLMPSSRREKMLEHCDSSTQPCSIINAPLHIRHYGGSAMMSSEALQGFVWQA